jgi:hypothetical protein
MSIGVDFAVNFAAGVVLGGGAASLQRVESRFRTRGPRRFWRPFIEGGQVRVVVGGPALEANDWEQSGMMGVGDALALRDLQSVFAQIGADADIRLTLHVARDELAERALVSLGGPDSNYVTNALMQRAETTLRFGNPLRNEVTIRDLLEMKQYSPRLSSRNGEDYGLIVRLPRSEELHHASAVIIGGSFGYGTWAGGRLIGEKQLLENPIVRSKSPFECLYKTEVVNGHLGRIKILALRRLSGAIRALSEEADPLLALWLQPGGGRGATYFIPGAVRPQQMPIRAETDE